MTKSRLERRLIEFRNQTNPSVEIAVVIVHTTGGRDIFEYSLAVARGWGIGSKEDDNPGLLLFIAFDDRKYFTHVSRDLEDELPDGVVGQIQRQYLVPAFRQGNYAKGIVDTVEAYIEKIQEKQSSTKVTEDKKPSPSRRDNSQVGFCEIC
ncbi:MAG: TPM domain-containing protein, partial [Leptospiraceae bacterium]|nr:TPM domain-containing protein [Leptospiraceae bacterium]